MAKRGRKPKSENKKEYFGEVEELAVIAYNNTDSAEEKDKIYNDILKPAFIKMIESIIRRYKLYGPEEEFDETFNDTLSFLVTKMSCYKPERGTKAYSYCGTVAKNYLIQKINQHQKKLLRNTPYEEVSDVVNNDIRYTEEEDTFKDTAKDLIITMATEIEDTLNEEKIVNTLSVNERKVGEALITLLNNWEEILDDGGSNKYNKSSVLFFLREETRLGTKEIRDGMKKFKTLYQLTKRDLIN